MIGALENISPSYTEKMDERKMKKIFIIVALASLIALCLLLAFFSYFFSEKPREFMMLNDRGEYVTVVVNCTVPALRSSAPAFEVVKHNYTEVEGVVMAREVFGITGEVNLTRQKWILNETVLVITNGTHSLSSYDDGTLQYSDSSDGRAIKLPETSEAKKIAEEFIANFLEKTKSKGLMPTLPQIEFIFSDMDISRTPDGVSICERISYEIVYDGLLLLETRAVIDFGNYGKITNFYCGWRYVESAGTLAVTVTPWEAVQIVGARTRFERTTPKIEKMYINDVELGGLVPSSVLEYDEILPAYQVKIIAICQKDGSEREYWPYVSATNTSTPLASMTLLRFASLKHS